MKSQNKSNNQYNHNNLNHLPNNCELVSGYQYNNQQGWLELYDMAENFLKDFPQHGEWDAQHLNSLINIEEQYGRQRGYAKGVREDGVLQCLLVAQMTANWWFDRHDCNIICILTKPKCNPKHTQYLIEHCEKWAQENNASSVFIDTWQMRPAYVRWAERIKYNKRSYVLQKELK